MKNKYGIIILIITILVVAGVSYIFIDLKTGNGNNLFFNKKKDEKPGSLDFNVDSEDKDKDDTPKIVVSDQSILKLAENKSLKIDDSLVKDIPEIDYLPGTVELIGIKIMEGELYLYSNDYMSKVIDLKEKVIALKKSLNGCDTIGGDVLILTEYGNLYIIPTGSGRFDTEVYNSLKFNIDISLDLKKIDTAGSKVLSFTTYINDSRGMTCGKAPSPVYTSSGLKSYVNNKLTSYIEIKDYVGIGENTAGLNPGFVIYSDNTISLDGVNKLKGSSGKNLRISEYYYGIDEKIYIIDMNNAFYSLSVKGNLKTLSNSIKSVNKDSQGVVTVNLKKSSKTIEYKQSLTEGFVVK